MFASPTAKVFRSDWVNLLNIVLGNISPSNSGNMFTTDLVNMLTSDLANMFPSEIEKQKIIIWPTSSLVNLTGEYKNI